MNVTNKKVRALAAVALFASLTFPLPAHGGSSGSDSDSYSTWKIKHLIFRHSNLQDVCAVLEKDSRKIDTSGKGMKINVIRDRHDTPLNQIPKNGIDLNLRNIDVMTALLYIANEAGMAVRIRPNRTVLLVPIDRL